MDDLRFVSVVVNGCAVYCCAIRELTGLWHWNCLKEWQGIMMNANTTKGNVMVKLLISLIMISVISTAILKIHQNVDQDVSSKEFSRLMTMRAKTAFDKIGYHFELAGYANDVDILFFVIFDKHNGILYETVDGLPRRIIDGVESFRIERSADDLAIIEISLIHSKDYPQSKIISKNYSTTVRIKNYL